MKISRKELIKIFLVSVLPVALVWLPFWRGWHYFYYLDLQTKGIFNVLGNWDGPHYLLIAISLYDHNELGKRLFMSLPIEYYYNHFPLYPLFIRAISGLFGYIWSGLFINLLFGFLTNLVFYLYAKKMSKHAVILTLLFTIFPARFWVVRSIIAPETMMLFFILASIYLYESKKYLLSGLSGAFSVFTKFQAIHLFPSQLITEIEKQFFPNFFTNLKTQLLSRKQNFFGYISNIKFHFTKQNVKSIYTKILEIINVTKYTWLIFGGLFLVFGFFYLSTGDWLTYFHSQKVNKLPVGLPFSQFNYQSVWASTGWLEDIVFYYAGIFLLLISLSISKKRLWFWFCLTYSTMIILIPQRDITRLVMPLTPFFFLQFQKFFTSKRVLLMFILILPAMYMYTLNFMMHNQAPVADWALILN